MLIAALLALLGVDLIVVVAFVAFVLARRRWVKRQPGAFAGAIRVTSGEVEDLGAKWKRGYGRRVRDVLVWTKAPILLRNEVVPIDRFAGERPLREGELRRMGDESVVIEFDSDKAKVEVVARAEHRTLVAGSWA
jgi:hypothetical protein